jgi:hypothetical protein
MDVSDVLLLTLLADAIGARVFSVPRLDSDKAQGHEGDQRSKELENWQCSAPLPWFSSLSKTIGKRRGSAIVD